jgi:regulatory protein
VTNLFFLVSSVLSDKAVTHFVTAFIFYMAGTITALKVQKRNKERVNVYLDDEFALAVTVSVAASLKKGQYLSEAEVETLKKGDERDKAYYQAVRFLGFRPRSQVEIEQHLRGKGYAAEVVEETSRRLIEQGYLDDKAFAQLWVENREQFRPKGARALRYELKQKGIEDKIIDTVLTDLDEAELAWAAVERKLRTWENLPVDKLKQKLIGFLSRRGFNYEITRRIFERAKDELNVSDEEADWF